MAGGIPQIGPQFEFARRFSEGLAAVDIGGKIGFIDKAGKLVIEPQFLFALEFSQGQAQVKLFGRNLKTPGKGAFIDRKGRILRLIER